MEVTAAVKNSTYTEGSTLTDKINRYILSNRASIASIAKEIGRSEEHTSELQHIATSRMPSSA